MVWYKDEYGLAAEHNGPLSELDKMVDDGVAIYAHLTGVLLNEGVQATAFTHFGATPVYDSVVALERGTTQGLEPIGVVADYKVECIGGEYLYRPRHGEDVREAIWNAQLERTGERPYQIAMLDTEDLTVFFTGKRRGHVERQLAAAVRKLYPEEKSLYTALANIKGLSVTNGAATAAPDDKVAGAIRGADGQVTFFLEDDERKLNDAVLAHYQADGAEGIFDLADARGDRICISFTWLTDSLVDQMVQARANNVLEGVGP